MADAERRFFMVGKVYLENDLPTLARRARERVRKTIDEVARELGLSIEEVEAAESRSGASLLCVQERIIRHYTQYCLVPETHYRLQRK